MEITFKDFANVNDDTTLDDWMSLNEGTTSSRYNVEVNFRTSQDEAMEAFAKICLAYVSAAMKQNDYHVKHVYEDKPIRILVSSRNWDDGEWIVVVSFNPDHGCFMISKGYYNKERKSASIPHGNTKKCEGKSAAEIAKQVRNMMHGLKNDPGRHQQKLKGVALKRGPKK